MTIVADKTVFGLAGWSGSGKTTLLTRLLPALRARGLSVSTVKHAHHSFDVDKPGKDSYEHRRAGAGEVLVASDRRWALMHENATEQPPDLATLIGHLSPVDLVIVEGFKADPHDKLEIHRPALGGTLLARDDPHVVAVASDAPVDGLSVPLFDLSDVAGIADFIIAHCGLAGTARGSAA